MQHQRLRRRQRRCWDNNRTNTLHFTFLYCILFTLLFFTFTREHRSMFNDNELQLLLLRDNYNYHASSLSHNKNKNNTEATTTLTTTTIANTIDTATNENNENIINILFCLSGSDSIGLMEETKVSMKSLLLNAPHDGDSNKKLRIFIIIDRSANYNLSVLFNETSLLSNNVIWWCPVEIRIMRITYSVMEKWKRDIRSLASENKYVIAQQHTWGTYYRLFANRILPENVQHYLYLDSDVIVLANLADLWKYTFYNNTRDNYLFQWSKDEVAGFMLFRNTPELWNTYINSNEIKTSMEKEMEIIQRKEKQKYPCYTDQTILQTIAHVHPELVKELPTEWSMHWTSNWKYRNNLLPTRASSSNSKNDDNENPGEYLLGMGHFNGGMDSPGPYWDEQKSGQPEIFKNKINEHWGSLFLYYITMPWSQVRFLGRAAAASTKSAGFPIIVTFENITEKHLKI